MTTPIPRTQPVAIDDVKEFIRNKMPFDKDIYDTLRHIDRCAMILDLAEQHGIQTIRAVMQEIADDEEEHPERYERLGDVDA